MVKQESKYKPLSSAVVFFFFFLNLFISWGLEFQAFR